MQRDIITILGPPVKNNASVHMAIAGVFREEVLGITDITGLHIYIVYNSLTLETIKNMKKNGGNALVLTLKMAHLQVSRGRVPHFHESLLAKTRNSSHQYQSPLEPFERHTTDGRFHEEINFSFSAGSSGNQSAPSISLPEPRIRGTGCVHRLWRAKSEKTS